MSKIVKINDTDLQVIEYRGQRVATLAQIDEVHARPEGTARRTFNEHKHRLVEGEDFFELDQPDVIRTLGIERPQGGTPGKVILISEQGYTMLVKPFTDDLAWQVQRQVVTGYFRAKELVATSKPARIRGRTALEQVKLINFVGDAIKNVPGIRLGRLAAAKLKAFSEQTGLDFSDFRRALPALPLDQMVHLNPTQIGQRIEEQTGRAKVSGQAVNKVLLAMGLQRKVEDGYVLTEAGTKYGEIHDYKAENDHSGLQIDWYESVVNVVRDNLPAETTKRKTSSRPAPGGPQGSAA